MSQEEEVTMSEIPSQKQQQQAKNKQTKNFNYILTTIGSQNIKIIY